MEVIVCHTNADFDALGCLTAAKLLRPKAVACFPGHMNKRVRELYSLYKDHINLTALEHINVQEVDHLIVVDTQSSTRIGKFRDAFLNPRVRLTIIDHHPRQESLPEWANIVVEEIGAATTLFVEEIIERGIELTPSLATILATAIYSDTGCLTTKFTTSRDAKAVAYLLDKGANLEVIGSYSRSPLSEGQRSLFEELLASSREVVVNEAKIRVTSCEIAEYVDGLAQLTTRLAEIDDCDACVAVVNMDDRIHIVGRSKLERINMQKLMQPFGGSGHFQAASATVKGRDMDSVIAEVYKLLPSIVQPPLLAKDIMSTPVRTVSPDTTMAEAGRIMLRSGHSGLPVVDHGKLLGIISRRDLDKANHHGLTNAPVKGFMSTAIVTAQGDTSVDEIQRLLIQKDIGRLPVLNEDGSLVGIVTRTDVLRTMHGKSYPHWYQATYRSEPIDSISEENVTAKLAEQLGTKRLGTLLLIGQEAERQRSKAYLVGGMVRDILLGHNNVDMDIVVEPEAAPVARAVAKLLHAECVEYPKFGTATLNLPNGEHIDLVTARTEFYAMPAAMPDVEYATIRQDLYRRDFTVNTLAVALNPGSFGNLLDFFGAREDLKQGLIRVLYNLSFVEDPTRIFRAVRFEQRYGFRLEEQTERFLLNALDNGVLEKVSREKLRDELRLLLEESNAARSILRMDELKVWQHCLPGFVVLSDRQINLLGNLARQELEGLDRFSIFAVVLMLYQPLLKWPELAETLKLPKKAKDIVLEFMERAEDIVRGMHDDSTTPSQLWLMLEPLSAETRLLIAALVGEDGLAKLANLEQLSSIKPALNGNDLIANGLRPGPMIGRILKELKKARLEGTISTREEELEFLNTLMARGLKGGN